MNIWPAQQDRQLFVIVFVSVILILLIGSAMYKYGYTDVSDDTTDIYQTITEDIAPVSSIPRQTVTLNLQPIPNQSTDGVEYQLVLTGTEQPVIGLAIKLTLTNANSNASISEVTISENLKNGPWQVMINKSEIDPDTNLPNMQFAATSTDLAASVIGENTVLGSFVVSGLPQPTFEITGDSLLTTDEQAYDVVLGSN